MAEQRIARPPAIAGPDPSIHVARGEEWPKYEGGWSAPGPVGPPGPPGPQGDPGPPGQGVPTGGGTLDALRKTGVGDFVSNWLPVHELPAGGAVDTVLTKNSATNYDAVWRPPTAAMPAYLVAELTSIDIPIQAGSVPPELPLEAWREAVNNNVTGVVITQVAITFAPGSLYQVMVNRRYTAPVGTGHLDIDLLFDGVVHGIVLMPLAPPFNGAASGSFGPFAVLGEPGVTTTLTTRFGARTDFSDDMVLNRLRIVIIQLGPLALP